jgi:hypothetical protein
MRSACASMAYRATPIPPTGDTARPAGQSRNHFPATSTPRRPHSQTQRRRASEPDTALSEELLSMGSRKKAPIQVPWHHSRASAYLWFSSLSTSSSVDGESHSSCFQPSTRIPPSAGSCHLPCAERAHPVSAPPPKLDGRTLAGFPDPASSRAVATPPDVALSLADHNRSRSRRQRARPPGPSAAPP